jgi:predicted permease
MGASRFRVVRQLLTESVLLSSLGGALGVALAFRGIRFLTLLLGVGRDNFTLHAELNWHVLGVTFALSVFTGLLFGLAPAIRATRVDVMPGLKQSSAGTVSPTARPTVARISPSQMLVAAQIALSLLLLVGAGLFGRTLSNLQSIELGFNRENVLLFTINPQAAGYERPALSRLYLELRDRLSQIPGVRAVSMSNRPLLSGFGGLAPVTAPGATPASETGPPSRVGLFSVGPGFFQTMQIPLVMGRELDERDGAGSPPVAVINQRLARTFGLGNPIDRTLILGEKAYRIVGVVGDALFLSVKEEHGPMLYLPSLSRPPREATYEVRAAGNPLDHANTVREVVRQFDPRLAVSGLKTQAAHIDQAINQEITLARLCMVFAALALVMACAGLYGTVAYNVTRRTGEIGVRIALGAQRMQIAWLVLREVFALGIVGLGIGLPAALAGSRYLESFLFETEPNDPLVLAVAVTILLVAALTAGYVPARRAARIEPTRALRHE